MDQITTGQTPPAAPPPGTMVNDRGYYVPLAKIAPQTLLENQLVATLCKRALEVQAVLSQFRGEAFSDADQFLDLLAEKYGARPRSAGNTAFATFDGLMKVEISTGHFITLGPELQSAKSLIDECLEAWSQGADENLRAIVNDAFDVGTEGKLKVDRILALRRVEISDPKWVRAMDAIGDAVRVTRSKRYVRFHMRENGDAPWQQITLDFSRVP